MFIDKLGQNVINNYTNYLRYIGMLSGLSSESDSPYINSRVAENIFCIVTGAENIGRSDCSADAKFGEVGIGVKTFLANNNFTMQKIAEFNRDAYMIRNKSAEEIVSVIAKLRNKRILSTKRIYGLDTMIYHCIVREPYLLRICELPMNLIDTANIKNIKEKNNRGAIYFKDGRNEYSFNLNKNTLFMRFDTSKSLFSIKVDILKEPYKILSRLLGYKTDFKVGVSNKRYKSVILPLFSDRGGRHVPVRSGLNQWNAAGRPRNYNEIYISIPAWIHKKYPGFFPNRKEHFVLKLPNGNELSAKVCQAGNKALMSNPNSALGKWLLREVMNIREGEILTYEILQIMGIDSVEVYKINDKEYKIDFRPIGTYDEFVEQNNNKM